MNIEKYLQELKSKETNEIKCIKFGSQFCENCENDCYFSEERSKEIKYLDTYIGRISVQLIESPGSIHINYDKETDTFVTPEICQIKLILNLDTQIKQKIDDFAIHIINNTTQQKIYEKIYPTNDITELICLEKFIEINYLLHLNINSYLIEIPININHNNFDYNEEHLRIKLLKDNLSKKYRDFCQTHELIRMFLSKYRSDYNYLEDMNIELFDRLKKLKQTLHYLIQLI